MLSMGNRDAYCVVVSVYLLPPLDMPSHRRVVTVVVLRAKAEGCDGTVCPSACSYIILDQLGNRKVSSLYFICVRVSQKGVESVP